MPLTASASISASSKRPVRREGQGAPGRHASLGTEGSRRRRAPLPQASPKQATLEPLPERTPWSTHARAQGQRREADIWYRRGDELGDDESANALGLRYFADGHTHAAEQAYRRADQRGSGRGRSTFGKFLLAASLMRPIRRCSEPTLAVTRKAAEMIAGLARAQGDDDRTDAAWRRAEDRGSGAHLDEPATAPARPWRPPRHRNPFAPRGRGGGGARFAAQRRGALYLEVGARTVV